MGANYSHTTRSTGTVLTDTIYNADHNNHITNMIPTIIDDYSANAATMQTTRDPYPGASVSLATSLAEELSGIRYIIKQITGAAQWYIDPTGLDSAIVSSSLTAVGTIATGVWQGTAVDGTYIDLEGTELKSTGEAVDTKYLRTDGDGTCSWQVISGAVTSVSGATGAVADSDIDHDQLANFAANEHYTQANITATGTIATGVWNGTSIGTTYTDAKVTSVSGSTGAVADGDIDHDSLANFAANEHYTQANITATGTIATGVWNGTSIGTAYTDAKVTSVSGSTGAVADGDIDHDSLGNFAANEHFTQANITATGTIASGTWQGTAVDGAYVDIEGTEVKSTGEAGGTKFLREDSDGTCSWQTPPVTSVSGSTGAVSDGDIDHDSLGNFAANEHFTQANITATGTIATGVWNGTAIGSAYLTSASTTVSGASELATTAETNTGTDTGRTVTPDALAGSYAGTKGIGLVIVDFTTDVATGDGKMYFHVPVSMSGMNLVTVHAEVITAGTTNTTDIQVHNLTQSTDMLSTVITIDSGETGSDTAATAAVIDTGNDDVITNDLLRIDVDAISTTAPKGLIITLEFRLP